jgi:hypothetical protein
MTDFFIARPSPRKAAAGADFEIGAADEIVTPRPAATVTNVDAQDLIPSS